MCLLLCLVSLFILFGKKNKTLKAELSIYEHYKAYLLRSFHRTFTHDEIELINLLIDRDSSNIVIHIPHSVCRSCAISLFEELRIIGIRNEDVALYFESKDEQLISEAITNSFQNTKITGYPLFSDIYDIIVIRNDKFNPGYMKYSEGDQSILDLLISP